MNYSQAETLLKDHIHLIGQNYKDTRKNQIDFVKELVVTPQDHPFFPEFIRYYKETGSYQTASEMVRKHHQDDILYIVKCVLQEIYDVEAGVEMHVLMDLKYVLKYISA